MLAEIEAQGIAINYEADRDNGIAGWGFGAGVAGFFAGTLALVMLRVVRGELAQTNERLARAEAEIARRREEREG